MYDLLISAIKRNNISEVKKLLEDENIIRKLKGVPDDKSPHPLAVAINEGRLEIVKLFLEKDLEYNERSLRRDWFLYLFRDLDYNIESFESILYFLESWQRKNPQKTLLDLLTGIDRDTYGYNNIFDELAFVLEGYNRKYQKRDSKDSLLCLLISNISKKFPQYRQIVPIPSYFFYSDSKTKSSIPAAARFKPVGAIDGDAWQLSSAPSSVQKKKTIIIDISFFISNKGSDNWVNYESRKEKTQRQMRQIKRLIAEGFKVIYLNQENEFCEFKACDEIDISKISAVEFKYNEEENYRKCGIERDGVLVLDFKSRKSLVNLFHSHANSIWYRARTVEEIVVREMNWARFFVDTGMLDDIETLQDEDVFYLTRMHNKKALPLTQNLLSDVVMNESSLKSLIVVATHCFNYDVAEAIFLKADIGNEEYQQYINRMMLQAMVITDFAKLNQDDQKLFTGNAKKAWKLLAGSGYDKVILRNILSMAIISKNDKLLKELIYKTDTKFSYNTHKELLECAVKENNQELIYEFVDSIMRSINTISLEERKEDINRIIGRWLTRIDLTLLENLVRREDLMDITHLRSLIVRSARDGRIDILQRILGILKEKDLSEGDILFNSEIPVAEGTALMAAINNNHIEIVKFLLDKVTDCQTQIVDKRNSDGENALDRAAVHNRIEILGILVAKMAKEQCCSVKPETLAIANNNNHHQILKILSDKIGDDLIKQKIAEGRVILEQHRILPHIPDITPVPLGKLTISKEQTSGGIEYTLEAELFTQSEVWEILNYDKLSLPYVPRVRCYVSELKGSKFSSRPFSMKYDVKEEMNSKKVADFASFEEKNDKGYAFLASNVKKGQDTKLLSLNYPNEIVAIKIIPEDVHISGFYKDEFGFYHIKTDKNCKIEYVLGFDTKEQEVANVKFKQVLDEYKRPGGGDFPVKSQYKDHKKFLEDVFASKKGSCGVRVEAFLHQLKKNKVKPENYWVVDIDGNHVALEIKEDGVIKYIDLGGSGGQVTFEPKEELPSVEAAAGATPALQPPLSPTKDAEDEEQHSAFERYIISQKSRKPLSVSQQEGLAQIISNQNSPLLIISKASNIAINHLVSSLRESNPSTPIFCIDNPRQVDFTKQVIKINPQAQALIDMQGFLKDFLTEESDKDAPKPVIIIDWTKFDSQQKVALNTIIDENPTINNIKLSDCKIISVASEISKDRSFISRHKEVYEINITTLPQIQESSAAIVEVDLEGFSDWQSKLFGDVYLDNETNEIKWQKSEFVLSLESGVKDFTILNCADKKTLEQYLARAKAFGYFSYHGYKIPLTKDTKINISPQTFNFVAVATRIFTNSTINRIPEDCEIINTQIFDRLFLTKKIKDGRYQEFDGLIKEAAKRDDKTLKIFITSQLTDTQIYCLFNEARKNNVSLEIYLAPQITLPQKIYENADVKENIGEKTHDKLQAHINICKDCDNRLHSIRSNHSPIITVNVEDCSYQDLIADISYRISGNRFCDFAEKKSEFVQFLEKGGRIVLKGEFSEELLQMLEPELTKDYAKNLVLLIENKEDTIPAHLSWLHENDCYANFDSIQNRSSPVTLPEDKLVDGEEFIAQREKKFQYMLGINRMVELYGESGVGKSSLVNGYKDKADFAVYNELGQFEKWASDKSQKTKILFIDEANIEDLHLTTFNPLKIGLPPSNPGKGMELLKQERQAIKIFYKGKFYDLDDKHRVVFAGNPLSYGGGRARQKLFEDNKINRLALSAMPVKYIYHLLKTEIFDKCQLAKLYEEDFKKMCEEEIVKYQQSLGHDNEITIRELQEYALRFLSERIDSKPLPGIKTQNFVSTKATEIIEKAVFSCLEIRRKQKAGILPNGGTNGVFLEGMSGIGKSSLIAAYLQEVDVDYIKIESSLSFEEKKRLIIEAFEQGKIIWIDELDSCIDSGIEKMLNLALSGIHPDESRRKAAEIMPGFALLATGNGIALEGRRLVGSAMRHRMICPRVSDCSEYKQEDIEKIIQVWLVGEREIEYPDEIQNEITNIAQQYLKMQERDKVSLRELKDYVLKENEVTRDFALMVKAMPPKSSPQDPHAQRVGLSTQQLIQNEVECYREEEGDIKQLKEKINKIVRNAADDEKEDDEKFNRPEYYCGLGVKTNFRNDEESKKLIFTITEVITDSLAFRSNLHVNDTIHFQYEEPLTQKKINDIITDIRDLKVDGKISNITIDRGGRELTGVKEFFSQRRNNDFIAKGQVQDLEGFKKEVQSIEGQEIS